MSSQWVGLRVIREADHTLTQRSSFWGAPKLSLFLSDTKPNFHCVRCFLPLANLTRTRPFIDLNFARSNFLHPHSFYPLLFKQFLFLCFRYCEFHFESQRVEVLTGILILFIFHWSLREYQSLNYGASK